MCVAACATVSPAYQQWRGASLPQMAWSSIAAVPARFAAAGRWASGRGDLAARFHSIWAAAPRMLAPLHLQPTTVDAYGFDQWVLMEGGVRYDPRPILQSYLAYTPALSRLNARFLRSADAPNQLLMQVTAIDGHYPSMEDALSWLPLLSDYQPRQPIDASLPVLPLQRRSKALGVDLLPYPATTATFGQLVPVPDVHGLVWAHLDVQLTPLGTLLQAAFKAPPLDMIVITADGTHRTFRLIPANARGGFLLSPAVLDNPSFAALTPAFDTPGLRSTRVTAVAVVPDPVGEVPGCYRKEFAVQFSRLELRTTVLAANGS